MEEYKGFQAIRADSRKSWRNWLQQHHGEGVSVWLVIFRRGSGIPSVTYEEAVEEALCFGWIDSKPNKRDNQSYYQFFSPRNPKSNWSRINKERVDRLTAGSRMAEAGLDMVRTAQMNGTWDALEEVDNLVVPGDLRVEFQKYEKAEGYWNLFPDSVKRGILEWIFQAKREDTRARRVRETAGLASRNIRANQFRKI